MTRWSGFLTSVAVLGLAASAGLSAGGTALHAGGTAGQFETVPCWANAAGISPPAISAPSSSAVALRSSAQGSGRAHSARSYPELPGWPASMGITVNYAPGGGPATVDVDGDGRLEVFAGSTDQKLYGWRIDGTLLPGFPITLSGMAQSSPAVGDVDGDGRPEILIVTVTGNAYCFHADGTAVAGWPKHPGGSVTGFVSVVLKDVDGDGRLEIILPVGNNLYVWRSDGTTLPGFPAYFASSYGPCATPAVADIDGDGRPEIVLEGWEYLHVFHMDGTEAAGWPYHLPLSYEGFSYSAPVLVDFDADGTAEIIAAYNESGGGNWSGKVAVWHHDGSLAAGWPYVMQDFGSWCYSTAALGDVDGDGRYEFAMTSHNGRLYLFRSNGSIVAGFPVVTGHVNSEASCAVADLDDDGGLEICYGSNDTAYLSYERDGSVTPGFPLTMNGGMMVSGSCVGDPDANGRINICAHDRTGKVHLWDLPFTVHADRLPWVRPHHDDHHTGTMETAPPSAVRLRDPRDVWELAAVQPNPARACLVLSLEGRLSAPVWLRLLDPAGRCRLSRRLDVPPRDGRAAIDLPSAAGLPSGVYYLRVESGGGVRTRPVVVLQ